MKATRSFTLWLAGWMLLTAPMHAFGQAGAANAGDPDCGKALTAEGIEASAEETLAQIEKLPPYALNYASLRESMNKLVQEVPELHRPFAFMKQLEAAQAQGKISPEVAYALSKAVRQETADAAQGVFEHEDPTQGKARKLLEGHRILLRRMKAIEERAVQKYQEEQAAHEGGEPKEGPAQEGSKDESKDGKKDAVTREELAESIREAMEKNDGGKVTEDQVASKSKPDFKRDVREGAEALKKKKESGKSTAPDDKSPDGKKAEKSAEDRATEKAIMDRLEQEMKEQAEKDAKEKGEGKGKGKGKGEGKGEGQGEGEGEGEGDGEKKPGGKGGKESRREGKDGKGETTREDGSQEDGSDGQTEGGAHGSKDLQDSLSDMLKKLKGEWNKDKEGKEDFSKLSPEELEKLKKEHQEKEKKAAEDAAKKLDKTTGPAGSELVERHLNHLWASILSEYQNSDAFLRRVADFSALCKNLQVKNHTWTFLGALGARSGDLYEKLKSLEVNFKDLDELALSLGAGQKAKGQSVRRVRFLERVLSEKESSGSLTEPEAKTLAALKKVLSFLDKNGAGASDKDVANTLNDQMLGPLSRHAVENKYSDGREVDPSQLVKGLKGGETDDLLVYHRLARFVNILFNDVYKPKYYEAFEGDFGPINESDAVIEAANDIEDLPYILRDGNPKDLELLRLLGGDLLKVAYREKVRKNDPRKPFPKKATIVLYDISGSMSSQNKGTLRNALVNALLDRSQVEVARGEGEHVVYLIPFDGKPHEPRRISSLRDAQAFFDEMRARPLGSGGDDSITEGMIKAYQLIAEHQKSGGELERGNILLITDAIAKVDFAAVEKARKEVDPSVDLALNAVTLGDWNQDVSEMVKRYAINGDGEIGKVSHQHISYEDITKFLDPASARSEILETAKDFSESKGSALTGQVGEGLKGLVQAISNHREMASRTAGPKVERALRQLEIEGESRHESLDSLIHHYFENTVLHLGKDWSIETKLVDFEAFMELCERSSHLDRAQVLKAIKPADRARLKKWLSL